MLKAFLVGPLKKNIFGAYPWWTKWNSKLIWIGINVWKCPRDSFPWEDSHKVGFGPNLIALKCSINLKGGKCNYIYIHSTRVVFRMLLAPLTPPPSVVAVPLHFFVFPPNDYCLLCYKWNSKQIVKIKQIKVNFFIFLLTFITGGKIEICSFIFYTKIMQWNYLYFECILDFRNIPVFVKLNFILFGDGTKAEFNSLDMLYN